MTEKQNKYAWNAEDYAKHSSPQYQWAKELIPKLKLSGNESLLDIGCGDGKITAVLAKSLPQGRVIGVDNSEDMINLARANFASSTYPNLSFQVMDARVLSFESEFDRVFSNAALHWVIDHRPILRGVHRGMKNGGRLLFQMGGKGNAQGILSVLDDLLPEQPWRKIFDAFTFPYGFYTPEEYRVWLCEAHLKPERTELLHKDMQLQGKEGLAGWVRTTWLPYTERLPEALRNEFVREIVNRYVEKHPLDEAGMVHVKMVRLEVEAAKPDS
jgi:trans-aconitate 2-methyltransferase